MKKNIRKTKKLNINNKQKLILLLAVTGLIICISIIYSMFGKYNGLGVRDNIRENPYSAENYAEENNRVYYNDDIYESVAVIDISDYQKNIDFNKVKEDGIDGVIVKAGYRNADTGEITMDSMFKENIRKAGKAGLEKGVYFFSQAVTPEEAIEEARFVVRNIKGRGVTLPVGFDMEPVQGYERINSLTVEEKTEIADAFCEVIKRNGFQPVVYGNPAWLYNNVDLSYLTDYQIWLAHYNLFTDYGGDFVMWQYSDSGQVNGIEGYVDLNIYIKGKR